MLEQETFGAISGLPGGDGGADGRRGPGVIWVPDDREREMPYTEKQVRMHEAALGRGEPIAIELRTHEQERAAGTLRLLRLTDEERGRRARRFLFICWAIALPCGIAPPHLLWVLALFTTGVIGYFVRRRAKELILGGKVACPKCGAAQYIEPQAAEFPFAHFCTECRKRSVVSLIAAEPAPAADPTR